MESLNGKLGDKFPQEIFMTLAEASLLIEKWRKDDSQNKPPCS